MPGRKWKREPFFHAGKLVSVPTAELDVGYFVAAAGDVESQENKEDGVDSEISSALLSQTVNRQREIQ